MKKNQKKITLFSLFVLFLLVGNANVKVNLGNRASKTEQIVPTDTLLVQQFNRAVDFLRKGDFQYSQQSFQNAIQTIQKGEILDKNMVYRTYVNYGVLLKRVGRKNEAIKYYQLAEKFILKEFGENSSKLIPIYVNEGVIFYNFGNLIKAQNYYEKAINLLHKHTNLRWLALTYNNLGVVFYNKGEYSESLNYYLKTLSIKKKLKIKNSFATYNNIANCYKKLGNYKKADNYFQISIEDVKNNWGENYYLLADSYLNYAVFQGEFHKDKNVLPYLNKAYDIYLKNLGLKHSDTARCLFNFGDFYSSKKDYYKALNYYQKAMISELDQFQDSSIYTNPSIHKIEPQLAILQILKAKAGAFHHIFLKNKQLNDLDFSLQTYDLCLDIIDKIRIAYQDEESKFALSKNENDTYTVAIELAVQLYELTKDVTYKEKAFRYAERSKSASLMSSLNDVNAKNFGGIPKDLQEQERRLKMDIAKYRESVYEERKKATPDRKKMAEWQDTLFNLNEEYNQMVLRFEKEYPDYYALKYDTKTIDIKTLQNRLENTSVFLEYSLSDSALFTFVVTKNSFDIQRQSVSSEDIDFNLKEVRTALKTNDFSKKSVDYYKSYTYSAHQLYKYLIHPNDSLIQNKKLVIVPDGKMAYIPFGVLLKDQADTSRMNYRNLNYLIRNNTITYNNSATLGFTAKKSKSHFLSNNEVLAFAPSYENISDSILYTKRSVREKLYPLPGVKEEVKNISKVISGDIYMDNAATERNFKEHAGDYDVLHLAMHTIIDDKNPMYSKLVFTQVPDSTEDGLLNTNEIYNMKFNARMVVLSACNTGDGKLLKGEGVMSLARGFFYAGCPSIIMTLWTVEDKTGSNLMTNFYSFLAQGMDKDDALRQAKLEYLKTADPLKSHPYFWSGYVTLGDVEPLYNNNLIWRLIYLAIGSFGIFMVFFFLRRRRKKLKA
ncbi:CHAT domain-containing protein [Ancylomarina longa]|uniref:CHAT domain-containing protein n=1 Tax=Ancylomarina longa TaxID=2487017 RepID=UPI000FCADE03|nr:CHAT domain-containing tetratricopeptide repeat protein [Ancylomarina longa]